MDFFRGSLAPARAIVTVAIVAMLVALGTIQAASYAFNAAAAVPGTLPTRVPRSFGIAVYRALDRAAPAPFVLSTLAGYELQRGNTMQALRYAAALPASSIRDDLLARIATGRGQGALAYEYYLAAPDVAAVQRIIERRAMRDPAAAYEMEVGLERRLVLLTTHPDDVAETHFQMGELANRQAWREVPGNKRQGHWLDRGMRDFFAAVQLAPLSEKYLIAAANQAMLLGDLNGAQRLFARAADADPASANAVAGLGMVAYQTGRVDAARDYLRRSRTIDPTALMVHALERALRASP